VVATEDFLSEGPIQTMCISRLLTDGVIETPGGAHFTACVPDYNRDEAFQKAYVAAAGDPEAWAAFSQRYLEVDERGYQSAVKEAAAEFAAVKAAEKAATAGGAAEKAATAGGAAKASSAGGSK
jgi:hypothetical protein